VKALFFAILISIGSLAFADNLSICLSGKFPSLCDKSKLTESQKKTAREAEVRENLNMCLLGKFPTLCNKSLLNADQLKQVDVAERRENYSICITGKYKTICNHSILTSNELKKVLAAENSYIPPKLPAYRKRRGGDCESGHWIDKVMSDGELVKLEDGSVWQVDAGDEIDSALWLPTSDIIACDGKLINTDDNETVGAVRIR